MLFRQQVSWAYLNITGWCIQQLFTVLQDANQEDDE